MRQRTNATVLMADEVRGYGTERWRKRAKAQIRDHPLCAMCLKEGKVTPAKIADHVIPHKGDRWAFWFGELQSLCAPHHASSKAVQEKRGYSPQIGMDGWPIDPQHPANRR